MYKFINQTLVEQMFLFEDTTITMEDVKNQDRCQQVYDVWTYLKNMKKHRVIYCRKVNREILQNGRPHHWSDQLRKFYFDSDPEETLTYYLPLYYQYSNNVYRLTNYLVQAKYTLWNQRFVSSFSKTCFFCPVLYEI